jgi:hypothetical protein
MDSKIALALRLELFWLLLTALVFCLVAGPVYLKLPHFPFFGLNLIFVTVFITASRYIFHLRYTFLAKRQVLKVAFFFASIPIVFYLAGRVFFFKTYLEEEGTQALVGSLPYSKQSSMAGYIQAEMLLFGVGSVIAMIVFAGRMILSVWRYHNRGTV